MNALMNDQWLEDNQRYLTQELSRVQLLLKEHAKKAGIDATQPNEEKIEKTVAKAVADDLGQQSFPFPLDTLCQMFALSSFERNILLLCAGMELQSSFAGHCAAAQGDSHRAYPTLGLALAIFNDAHWSALIPSAPLRYWRLIEIRAGETITSSPIKIDERVLHYLAGLQYLDEQLIGFVEPIQPFDSNLVSSQKTIAEAIADTITRQDGGEFVVQICGNENDAKTQIALTAVARIGFNLHFMNSGVLPATPVELDTLIRLWERESFLSSSALLLDCDDQINSDVNHAGMVNRFVENTRSIIIMLVREPRQLSYRKTTHFYVKNPTTDEQCTLWQQGLGASAPKLNGKIQKLASQFDLGATTINMICKRANGIRKTGSPGKLEGTLWKECQSQLRPKMGDLAQLIEPLATWDDLVLPQRQLQNLRDIAIHVRQRVKVFDTWCFRQKSARGLGVSALFAGASGTGKTMAAEVLANELQLDVYRIDLSQVVSKYIGETEKNLRKVFDAAEQSAAILLFDEADALFGKRSEVKDSHDRYANIEVSYLLQRMESYRGLAILTTNLKDAIDDAFLRRLRFIVTFPFPNINARKDIWQRIFPEQTPTEQLDIEKLARLNVTGGNIRNIALHAAFLAADADESVRMNHVLSAARSEYAKLDKPLSDSEIRGWV